MASALATTLLSLAIATTLSEVLLKPVFVADIVRFVELRERLKKTGIHQIGSQSDIKWQDLFDNSSTIKLVITRPKYWQDSHLARFIARAGPATRRVELYFPNPDLVEKDAQTVSDLVAINLGYDPKAYKEELLLAAKDIESAWVRNKAQTQKSTLTIEYLDSVPLHELASFDDNVIVIVPPVVADRTAEHLASHFVASKSTEAREWVEARWRSLTSSTHPVPKYSDRPSNPSLYPITEEDK
ncbi:hypothetical protein AAIH25_10785 [Arthrobacter crystallopoietes]|uniref:hypothetical protein n=1 Tax=Crystallibacter crystallopoietes TaxID=37928 RepID=UPI003D1ECC9C